MKVNTAPEYLLDTNILLETFWGKEPIASTVKNWIKEGKIALCPICIAEILSKASREEKEKLKLLQNQFEVLPIDATVAEIAGNYRFDFSRKSKKIYLLDCFVAACAKLYNLKLVTHNLKDYPMEDVEVFDIS